MYADRNVPEVLINLLFLFFNNQLSFSTSSLREIKEQAAGQSDIRTISPNMVAFDILNVYACV